MARFSRAEVGRLSTHHISVADLRVGDWPTGISGRFSSTKSPGSVAGSSPAL